MNLMKTEFFCKLPSKGVTDKHDALILIMTHH